MKISDKILRDYCQELEADNDNLRFDLDDKEQQIKLLQLELRMMWYDRSYVP